MSLGGSETHRLNQQWRGKAKGGLGEERGGEDQRQGIQNEGCAAAALPLPVFFFFGDMDQTFISSAGTTGTLTYLTSALCIAKKPYEPDTFHSTHRILSLPTHPSILRDFADRNTLKLGKSPTAHLPPVGGS